ncbi:MAG: hypothetical protein ACSNEK_02875 [Parachlamydiaceae bacterium]
MFTFTSILLAFFLAYEKAYSHLSDLSSIAMAGASILLLLVSTLSVILSYIPLQLSQTQTTSRLFDLYKKDKRVLASFIGSLLFSFFALLAAVIKTPYFLSLWVLLMGLSLDLFTLFARRTLLFLDPFQVVKMLQLEARKNIEGNKEAALCDDVDSLAEVAIASLNRNNVSLSNGSIDELRHTVRVFLESYKSIGHVSGTEELKKQGIQDTVQFILLYILQRFEMVFDHALEKRLATVCSGIITALGQTTIAAAKYDISMAIYPLHYLSRLGQAAQKAGLEEIGVKTSLTLLEIAKTITIELDVAYIELQQPFLTIINTLDEIAKETFRRDKTTNIQLLIQNFLDLKSLFSYEKMAKHQDTPIILQNIDRVIDEFKTLQSVIMTMPPMPNLAPDESNEPKTDKGP